MDAWQDSPAPGSAAWNRLSIGVVPSPGIAEQAQYLLWERRVFLSAAPVTDAIVLGRTAVWHVEARHEGVTCDCPAGANLDPVSCSHKVAAQIAWAG